MTNCMDRAHYFIPDGKKYTGEFINGKRHGEGTFYIL